jgi:biopolymer transport protein ExbD
MRIRHTGRDDKIELSMTPMIDIVFQLNIFFLFTFKIVLPEGDFFIHMPSAAAARAIEPSDLLPLALTLKAEPDGTLADLRLAGRSFGNGGDAFARLRQHVRGLVDDAGGPGTASEQEIEIDCDYDLNYDYVIKAITAITGYVENGQQHKLIERIKFTPPKTSLERGATSTE